MHILGVLDEVEKGYDLFIRNEASLCQAYPERMTVKDNCTIEVPTVIYVYTCDSYVRHGCALHSTRASVTLQPSEFERVVKTEGMNLHPRGVLVVWKWK